MDRVLAVVDADPASAPPNAINVAATTMDATRPNEKPRRRVIGCFS